MKSTFEIKKITNDIYQIREAYFSECANLFLIKGAEYDLLIDSGTGMFDVRDFLISKGFKPKVVLTHSHFDHAGGIKHFPASDIFVTPAILKNLKKRKMWGLKYLEPNLFSVSVKMSAKEFCKTYTVQIPKRLIPHTRTLIEVGRYHFEVLSSPGHTDDSIILIDRKNKVLASGDTLYHGTAYFDLPNSDKAEFVRSLRRLKKIDADLVLTGHGDVLSGKQALLLSDRWIETLLD